jgi:putative SOS response-associated peptidase YedK
VLKSRTWVSVKGDPIFAWGGLWRDSADWGSVYSGVMTDCNEAIRPVHDRMPVLLHRDEYYQWLHGSFEEIVAFQERCSPGALIGVERTAEPWAQRKTSPIGETLS